MNKIVSIFETFFRTMIVILGVALVIVVTLQIFSRYVLVSPIFWTEEVSRFLFIGIVTFGAPLAVRSGEYIRVDILISNRLPKKAEKILLIIIDFFVAIFLFIVAYNAINFITVGHLRTSPVLPIRMSFIFTSMLIAPLFTGIFFTFSALERILEKGDK